MRTHSKLLIIFVLLIILPLALPVSGEGKDKSESKKASGKTASVESIYDESVGDFLDANMAEITKSAWTAYQEKDYETAARLYLDLLKCNITDSTAIYNLSCCYGLLGKDKLAAKYLEKAFKAGFQNIGYINQDPDFDKVRGSEAFKNTISKLDDIIKEKAKASGKTMYVEGPTNLTCQMQVPGNFDPQKKYNLVIGLHGLGGNSNSFMKVWNMFNDPDFIFVAPQAPYAMAGGGEIGYSWSNVSDNKDILPKVYKMNSEYIHNVIQNMKSQYKIDKVYLSGFSQGAAFTYIIGLNNPEWFDGLICFGGFFDTAWVDEASMKKASKLKVFIGHANDDPATSFEGARKTYELLKSNGNEALFYEFTGGHTIDPKALLEAQKWMLR